MDCGTANPHSKNYKLTRVAQNIFYELKMKPIYLLLAFTFICTMSYFYMAPTVTQYKDLIDAQAYQKTNLLEGIDFKPLENHKDFDQ